MLAYIHRNNFVHRDIKCSNLLLSNYHELKLADFGLARSLELGGGARALTNKVITLWYRPPELLLGTTTYACGVDMWSVGCITAELLLGRPLFPGKSEPEQLALIFSLLGSPAADDAAAGPGAYTAWPNFFKPPADSRLPHVAALAPKEHFERRIEQKYPPSGRMSHEALALIARLLLYDPMRRMTAPSALESQYFCTQPRAPDDPRELEPLPFLRANTSLHEFQTKKRLKSQAAAKALADANDGAPRADGGAAARTGAQAAMPANGMPSRFSQAGSFGAGRAGGAGAFGAAAGMGGGAGAGGGAAEAARPPPPAARREHGARGGGLPEVDRTLMAIAASASHYPQHSGPLYLDPHHAIERDGQTRAAHSGVPHGAAPRYHAPPRPPPPPVPIPPPHMLPRR